MTYLLIFLVALFGLGALSRPRHHHHHYNADDIDVGVSGSDCCDRDTNSDN